MIRSYFKEYNIGGYIVPRSDEHLNEYINECDNRVQFLTGFTGSNGVAVVCDLPVLYTDSRYYIQAINESKEYKLKKMGEDPKISEYLKDVLKVNRVGICKRFFSSKRFKILEKQMNKNGIVLVPFEFDLVDLIWHTRSKRVFNPVYSLENKKFLDFLNPLYKNYENENLLLNSKVKIDEQASVVGLTYKEKLNNIQKMLKPHQALIIAEMDTVAWIFNLRGSDIEYNPLFYSYSIISKNFVKLYTNAEISLEDVEILKYETFEADLKKIKLSFIVSGDCNAHIVDLVGHVKYTNRIKKMQSIKKNIELEGFSLAYTLDGIALCSLYEWISNNIGNNITEQDIDNELENIKKKNNGYVGRSFETIAAAGPNGAIVHHRASEKVLAKEDTVLIDCGSQYFFGTTDTTRTLHFGNPSKEFKKRFTLVLKGHLNAMMLKFKKKTNSCVLDALARAPLWKKGLDFGHSTGHGVGHFLCVHECPPFVSFGSGSLYKNQVFSIEPGYYKEGEYGIRIESLVFTKKVSKDFLKPANLTYVPYQLNLIDLKLLSEDEILFLNTMNADIRKRLEPLLKGKQGYDFMMKNTTPITK